MVGRQHVAERDGNGGVFVGVCVVGRVVGRTLITAAGEEGANHNERQE